MVCKLANSCVEMKKNEMKKDIFYEVIQEVLHLL